MVSNMDSNMISSLCSSPIYDMTWDGQIDGKAVIRQCIERNDQVDGCIRVFVCFEMSKEK